MLQNPGVAFRDPVLKRCRIEKDQRGQPRPWSGAFAVVYKGIGPDGSAFAVRVFTTESPERRQRYDATAAYLRDRRLSCMVPFEYRDASIRSAGDGRWYPLILMDWVEGETLYKWVRARSLEGHQRALAAAAGHWLEVVQELADAGIAHGDLQHANVMVTPQGWLKLVDYDGLCVPALVGRRNLEVGVEPYQHPQRNAATLLNLDMDHFSTLVIYVALKALAADPSLWNRYVEQPASDKLLFRTDDFRTGQASPLYQELARSSDEEVRELAAQLFNLYRSPIQQVPPLAHLTNSYGKVEWLLGRQQWAEAVTILNRRGQFRDAPEHLKPLIREAYEHVCRQDAWTMVQKIPDQPSEKNDQALVSAWNDALLADFEPAQQQRPRLAAARQRLEVAKRMHYLVQHASRPAVIGEERQIVDLADQLPADYDRSLVPRIARARQRVKAIGRLALAMTEPTSEAKIAKAWRRVEKKQCAELADAEQRARVELAHKRIAALDALGRIPAGLRPDELDRRVLAAWDDGVMAGCPEADPCRDAYHRAVHRREALGRLRRALDEQDDAAVAEIVQDPLMVDYPLPTSLAAALEMSLERSEGKHRLLRALQSGARSAFVEYFDARTIHKHQHDFARHRSKLSQWTQHDVLLPERLGLGPALGRASLVSVDPARRAYRLRWTWPQQRYTTRCFLAVLRKEPDFEGPDEVDSLHGESIGQAEWEDQGGSFLLTAEPDWEGACVAVWAEVDLGVCRLWSEPLVLGRIGQGPRCRVRRRKPWSRKVAEDAAPQSEEAPSTDEPAPTARTTPPALPGQSTQPAAEETQA